MKRIQLGTATIVVINPVTRESRTENTVLHCIELVLESVPQKSDTESLIVGGIRKRVDKAKEEGLTFLEIEDSELVWLQDGLKYLRSKEAVTGSKWATLVESIR
jgi:hypothetical protein